MPSHSAAKIMHFLRRKASTKVSRMWTLTMCSISSVVAKAIQVEAWDSYGPHVCAHLRRNMSRHCGHWTSLPCGVPECHLPHSVHSANDFSNGGQHSDHHTLPQVHRSHCWCPIPCRGSHVAQCTRENTLVDLAIFPGWHCEVSSQLTDGM